MNSFRVPLRNQPNSLLLLGTALATVLLIGLGLSFAIFVSTVTDTKLYSKPMCFSAECVTRLTDAIQPALNTAKATLDVGVAIATIGGIVVALLNYLSSVNNAALTNHIEHLKVFTEYVETEIKKRDRLSQSQFDTLLLYGKIFSQSRSGKTTVSDEYRQFVVDLNSIIGESNERCTVGTPGGFSYNDHQRRVRDHLIYAGITVYTAPRNDYLEMENQLFSLLHRVSQSFCPTGILPEISSRKYY